MNSEINTVYQLRPVDFVWKETEQADKGLIAEEVLSIYPEFVSVDEEGNAQGVHYSKIVSVLVKSIQELKDEIDILKAQVNG